MSFDNLMLLDATLDDLADLKKFEPFPAGSYRFQLSWDFPEDDEVVIVVMKMKNLECLEVPGVEEDKLPALDKEAMFWMRLQNKDGSPMLWPKTGEVNDQDQGRLKEILTVLAPIFNPEGTLTNRELILASEGAEVAATLKVKASKNDADVKFNVIKHIALVE